MNPTHRYLSKYRPAWIGVSSVIDRLAGVPWRFLLPWPDCSRTFAIESEGPISDELIYELQLSPMPELTIAETVEREG